MSSRRSGGGSGRSVRVYVGNLNYRTTIEDVEHFFRRFKKRFDVLLKDGFGFVVSGIRKKSERDGVGGGGRDREGRGGGLDGKCGRKSVVQKELKLQ